MSTLTKLNDSCLWEFCNCQVLIRIPNVENLYKGRGGFPIRPHEYTKLNESYRRFQFRHLFLIV